jgi:nitrogen fixation protein NifT
MANIMLRKNAEGQLVFYMPKKDLEEIVVALEHDRSDKWGGELTLGDGSKYYVEPLDSRPELPKTIRAKRLSELDD